MQLLNNYATHHYDGLAVRQWLLDNVDLSATVAGLYLTFVFMGPAWLEKYVLRSAGSGSGGSHNEKPFLLKWSWALWNLLLSVFSFYGTTHVTPPLIQKVRAHGLRDALCTLDEQEFYFGPIGMALGLYCLSKGPELMDTVFLLLSGKKRLPFLQWFHHVTTFLYCWHAYAAGSSALKFAAALNYSVHTIMYFYFALAEAGFKNLVKPFGVYITLLQIAQMVVGTWLTSMLISYKVKDFTAGRVEGEEGTCSGASWSIARVQLFIAGVNLILFTDMFLKAYVFKKKKGPVNRNGEKPLMKTQ